MTPRVVSERSVQLRIIGRPSQAIAPRLNRFVKPAARLEGWNGENVIYLGDGKYFGHPFGISDKPTILAYLNSVRRTDIPNPRRAYLSPSQVRLDPDSLFAGLNFEPGASDRTLPTRQAIPSAVATSSR